MSEFGLLDGVLNAIANPLDTIRNTINGIGEAVGDLIPDIDLLNGVLEELGLNAEQTDEQLNELNPSTDADGGGGAASGSGGDGDGGLASSLGGDRGLLENVGLFAGGGALLGGALGSVVPVAGTAVGAGIGASVGTGIGSLVGAAVTDPDVGVDASDGGSDDAGQGRKNQQPRVVQNNNISVRTTANPTETRQAVRRAVEDANRQQRNAESGRVD
uniref:Uncharacterized protein n=1 Tax=uncultured virus TaxID=340016 RepID=D5L2G6_9VIRU|nr:hypothetical protein [uncultured virus]